MRYGFILLLCLFSGYVSIAQSQQSSDLIYRNLEVVLSNDNGLQGLGLKGSVSANRASKTHHNLMHLRCVVVISDANGVELYRSDERSINEFTTWRMFPNQYEVMRSGNSSYQNSNVVFVPFTMLNTSSGEQTLKAHIELSDVFETDWLDISPQVSIQATVPEKMPVWVKFSGMEFESESDRKKMPEDARFYLSNGPEKLSAENGEVVGWLNFSKGDRLQLGVESEKVGRTSGFRLFKIQITQGHDYYYTDELAAQFLNLDSLLNVGTENIPVHFDANKEIPPFTARLSILDRRRKMERINPVDQNRPVLLGSKIAGEAGKSGYVELIVPLRCIDDFSERTRFYAELWIGEVRMQKSGSYLFDCTELSRMDFGFNYEESDPLSYFGTTTDAELATTADGAIMKWFVPLRFIEAKTKGLDTTQNPITVKFLSEGGLLEANSAELLWEGPVYYKEIETWQQEKRLNLIIIISAIVGVMAIGIFLLIKYLNDRKKKQLTDFRIG